MTCFFKICSGNPAYLFFLLSYFLLLSCICFSLSCSPFIHCFLSFLKKGSFLSVLFSIKKNLGTSTGYADGDESHKRKHDDGDSTEPRKRCLIRTPQSCVIPTREVSIENPGKYFYEILFLRVSKFVFLRYVYYGFGSITDPVVVLLFPSSPNQLTKRGLFLKVS